MAKLTAKQKRFVEEYLIDLNATQAAIRSGYKVDNAQQMGSENLSKPVIAEAIGKAMAERSKRTGISQDRVIQELAKIAFVNITDIVNDDGSIKYNASNEDLACIESIKVKTSESSAGSMEEREVKVASKVKTLELLGKHLGMWNDKLDVNLKIPTFIDDVPEDD